MIFHATICGGQERVSTENFHIELLIKIEWIDFWVFAIDCCRINSFASPMIFQWNARMGVNLHNNDLLSDDLFEIITPTFHSFSRLLFIFVSLFACYNLVDWNGITDFWEWRFSWVGAQMTDTILIYQKTSYFLGWNNCNSGSRQPIFQKLSNETVSSSKNAAKSKG